MLPSRGLLRSSPALGLARAALPRSSTPSLSSHRHFGTAFNSNRAAALLGASAPRRTGGPLASSFNSQQPFFATRQARNASTQSTIPPATTGADASTLADGSSLADLTATPVNLSGSELLDIPEQIGFLKTLGLDYGWGPTSLMQTVLESIYVYTGLPWWASIAAVAIAVRLALLKPTLDASENQQRYQDLLKDPRYKAATEEMKSMLVTGNHIAGAEARARVSLMNKAAGYSLMKNFVPMLQIPLGYGMFRLMRGMAALPVPSFETGGILWFTDLTVSDPYFLLPIITGIVVTMGFRIPLPYMAPQQAKMMKMMSLAILPISTIVSLFLPAGTTWYFFLSSALHLVQQWLIYQPWLRRMIGMRPLTRHVAPEHLAWQAPRIMDASAPRVTGAAQAAATSAPASETMFQSLKSTLADAKEKLNERADVGAKERAHKAARNYDEKRALEEKEKLLARMGQKGKKNERY